MSATAMQVANHTGRSQLISEKQWVALFPKQVAENYIGSLTFVKQLTVVAVSTITYLKSAFPEESYSNEMFAGLNLKMLKNTCEDEMAQFVSSSLKQAFEAIDKKFVHQLALCFYDGDCVAENLIEYHIFEYSYNSDGVTFSINSKNRNSNKKAMRCSLESVKARTAMLVRAISLYIHQNCQEELPTNYDVSLRLYYTEDCPENYQAPGFESSIGPDHLEATKSEAVCHGWVETPYHKLIARSFVYDVLDDSDAAAATDCTGQPEITQAEHEDVQAELPRESDSASSMEPRVHCACGKQDGQGQKLLVCQYCHTLQHAVCFGLLAPAPGAAHCCAACAARDPARTPTCSLLCELTALKQECLCLLRRTLVLCSQTAAMSGAQLQAQFRLSPTSTANMLRLLAAHYIVPDCDYADLETPRKINHLRLKLTLKKFFQMEDEEDDTADRLMMEEEQEATEPVGEMLRPTEKISLHNTFNPGTVVDSPAPNIPGFNADLVQLGELICGSPNKTMANNDVLEELPLSGSFDPVKDAPTKKLKRKKGEDDEQKPKKLTRLRSGH